MNVKSAASGAMPPARKPWVWIAAVVIIAGAGIVVWCVSMSHHTGTSQTANPVQTVDPVNFKNFSLIQNGMSKEEVEAMMQSPGEPTATAGFVALRTYRTTDMRGFITVTYAHDVVSSKMQMGMDSTDDGTKRGSAPPPMPLPQGNGRQQQQPGGGMQPPGGMPPQGGSQRPPNGPPPGGMQPRGAPPQSNM